MGHTLQSIVHAQLGQYLGLAGGHKEHYSRVEVGSRGHKAGGARHDCSYLSPRTGCTPTPWRCMAAHGGRRYKLRRDVGVPRGTRGNFVVVVHVHDLFMLPSNHRPHMLPRQGQWLGGSLCVCVCGEGWPQSQTVTQSGPQSDTKHERSKTM